MGLLCPTLCTHFEVLDLSVLFSWDSSVILGRNWIELKVELEVHVFTLVKEYFVGSNWWVIQVSFKVPRKLSEALQILPDKYRCHFSKLESVAFFFFLVDLASTIKCVFPFLSPATYHA